ncbi:hypothetical protein VTK73DRAFT_7783 [Phialemonium thermophilum]|uniref:DUF6546 domain-containing protein n=1 Tax=Phialemonium thermophilum TaxID=223376 RepID=A0ABR3WCM7_9PEZI
MSALKPDVPSRERFLAMLCRNESARKIVDMIVWGALAAEIRLMILECAALAHREQSEPRARVGYATVCREWRAFWEKETFRRIIVHQHRVHDLDSFVGRPDASRVDYVEHIWLRVELDEYGCDACQVLEDGATLRRNDTTFSRALWTLLEVMSRWKRSDCRRDRELVLEIGAYSPSDSKHDFRDFRLEKHYPFLFQEDLEGGFSTYRQQEERESEQNDAFHGWFYRMRMAQPAFASKKRLMGTKPLELGREDKTRRWPRRWQRFPPVEIVTDLLFRRHFYRAVSVDVCSKLLNESLTRLAWFRHERWHDIEELHQLQFIAEYTTLLSAGLPDTLKQLFLLEDDNSILHLRKNPPGPDQALSEALSRCSRKLEKLSAAHLVDARHFYADFWPAVDLTPNLGSRRDPWMHLKTLILTSVCLYSQNAPEWPNRLLMAAGTAAYLMPRLEILELWMAGRSGACYFRYESDHKGRPKFTWRSNWEVDLVVAPEVLEVWRGVGRRMAGGELKIRIAPLKRPACWGEMRKAENYGDVLRHLGLRLFEDILHPVSAYQLAYESQRGKRFSRC